MRAFMILLGALGPAFALGQEPGPKAGTAEEKPWLSTLPPLPEIEPITGAQIDASIWRGVDFLISSQNKNGSWGSATMTKGLNITAPIPGAHHAFRAGSTGLALEGLLRSGDRRRESVATIEKAEAWFLKELPRLRRATVDTMYNIWGHSYGIKALAELYRYREGDEAKRSALKNLAQTQVQRLQRYEDVNGGWGYYDFDEATQKPTGIPTSFTTATVMMALHKGRDVMDLELPPREVERGLAFLQRQQTPDFAYVYSNSHRYRPRYSINRPGGSLCRSPACNVARRVWGDPGPTDEIVKIWLDRLILRNGWVDIARKRPRPHSTHFANSGYFYFYGHYYAMDCIALLPQTDRSVYYQHYAKIMLSKQEKNGCWWDYPLYQYHYAYGTGYALCVLAECRKGAK
ncbi:MAG: hypothetical protein VCA40_06815 [Roseibacillus sp.]